jgi:hypothetical protein
MLRRAVPIGSLGRKLRRRIEKMKVLKKNPAGRGGSVRGERHAEKNDKP